MSTLTKSDRQELASTKKKAAKNYAFPEKAPESGSYPIHDASHGKAALSYGKQHLSAKKYAMLKKKVCAKQYAAGWDSCTA